MSTHDLSNEREELQRVLDDLVADGTIVKTGRTRRAPDGTDQAVYVHSASRSNEKVKVIRIKYLDDLSVEELLALADEIERDNTGTGIDDPGQLRRYATQLEQYSTLCKSGAAEDEVRRALDGVVERRANVMELLHWHCVGVPA